MSATEVLNFWFEETDPGQRFSQDPDFDRLITSRFLSLHERARNCELYSWRETPPGCLAEVIVLDQFSRNIFRNRAAAFSCDSLALALAQEAIRRGFDQQLEASRKSFLYMPYMHSESKDIHEQSLRLFAQPGLEKNLDFEKRHKAIIDRFGRYPHRNEVLGRESTPEELEFLKQPGSSF